MPKLVGTKCGCVVDSIVMHASLIFFTLFEVDTAAGGKRRGCLNYKLTYPSPADEIFLISNGCNLQSVHGRRHVLGSGRGC